MTAPPPRSNALMIILVVCVIAILGLLMVITTILINRDDTATPTSTPPPVTITAPTGNLDHAAVESGIAKVLKSSYGIDDVSNIQCPPTMPSQLAAVYLCALKIGGDNKSVTITVTRADGTYEVGRPR